MWCGQGEPWREVRSLRSLRSRSVRPVGVSHGRSATCFKQRVKKVDLELT
jgi:hypothetical protein